MRKNSGDMEIALEVPQPRLRAVPADPEPVPAPHETSDAELLARVGRRDREAFEILYGRYVRPVFSLALRRLGDRGHAEDAVQEAFAAGWRSASTYRPERVAAGEERERLRGVHELLLQAGLPAELPPHLREGPSLGAVRLQRRTVKRRALLLLAAALSIVAVFAAGYAVADQRGGSAKSATPLE